MKKYIPILLILLLSAVLRLTVLTAFPSGLNADEAALGYNAYSLLLTGRDEHGHVIPVNLESFGDYKPALYSYLLVPLVKTLGLTEFAVRLPSAMFGILAVFLIYVLSNLLLKQKFSIFNFPFSIGEIAALLLAISPWHLHFSRGAWEVNVATTLILLGLIFYLKCLKKSFIVNFTLLIVNFSLAMYAYQSARVIAPLLGVGLLITNLRFFWSQIKQILFSLPLLLFLLLPIAYSLFTTDASSRLSGVGLLADIGPVNLVKELRGHHTGATQILGKILHNRPVIYSIQFVKNYLSHFDGNFLFINGDVIERNRVPETGLLYFTDAAFLVLGLMYLLKIINCKLKIIFIWLAVAPVASALTFQVPHALRAQNLVIPLTIITSAGIYFLLSKLNSPLTPLLNQERGTQGVSSKKSTLLLFCLLFAIYFWQFTRYLHEYYVHYPQFYPAAWEYGFKEMAAYVGANQNRYEQVLITDKYDQPYILLLFYLKYPPVEFQGHHELSLRDRYNFSTVKNFAKYRFTDTSWDKIRDIHGSLIIAAPEDIPPVGVNVVRTIYFPGGSPAFKIVSN